MLISPTDQELKKAESHRAQIIMPNMFERFCTISIGRSSRKNYHLGIVSVAFETAKGMIERWHVRYRAHVVYPRWRRCHCTTRKSTGLCGPHKTTASQAKTFSQAIHISQLTRVNKSCYSADQQLGGHRSQLLSIKDHIQALRRPTACNRMRLWHGTSIDQSHRREDKNRLLSAICKVPTPRLCKNSCPKRKLKIGIQAACSDATENAEILVALC